jgi:U3 small nucleolar RNA-associated protein 14
MENRVAKRMRAEEVLAELARSPDGGGVGKPDLKGNDESQKRLRMNNGSSQKVVRKRKQRTINLDSDESSSDTSSDSDESSDDSTAQNDDSDASSSSSSSSSESDSEVESGDDSEEESDDSEKSDDSD